MSYYAPFYTPMANYAPNVQNGFTGQNYAPQGYNNQQQNIQQPNVTQIPQNDSSMIWVLGKNEAESYPVAPNCQVVLWDKNAPTLYVKSMSANGIPNMRTLDFTERTETQKNAPTIEKENLSDKFVSKEDFRALKLQFDELKIRCDDLTNQKEYCEDKMRSKGKSGVQKIKDGEK